MQGELGGIKTLIRQESRLTRIVHCFAYLQLTLVVSKKCVQIGNFDTRWRSHYKSFENFISSFDSIVDVLDALIVNASTLEERESTLKFLRIRQMFETKSQNDLNVSLQIKEQDIANAMIICKGSKDKVVIYKR
ncbi:hypothetical protein H5410_055705 [Solanum commersonii]|uniref:Uncharacterized protein n=1 Tax=Solanum commersonii TaxID=4109 RepID=A0A9J5WIA0_SOLCO|nr:hypothetical protein H5410_055705 [Solanum commersonii]